MTLYSMLSLAWLLGIGTARSALIEIVAHRGASHDAPENTLAAFRLAWKQGADAIEGDFRLTKDQRIVCLHDATTERTAATNWTVVDHTFAQLRTLDVGAWKDRAWTGQKIPSLEEVLATVPPGKRIFIELKSGLEIIEPLRRIIARSPLRPQQMIVISFDAHVIAEVKKQLPELKAYWLTAYKKEESTGRWTPPLDEILSTLHAIRADGLDSQAQDFVDHSFAKAITAAGFELHLWTVDDPNQAKRFCQVGIRSITTNRPGWLRRALASPSPITAQGADK